MPSRLANLFILTLPSYHANLPPFPTSPDIIYESKPPNDENQYPGRTFGTKENVGNTGRPKRGRRQSLKEAAGLILGKIVKDEPPAVPKKETVPRGKEIVKDDLGRNGRRIEIQPSRVKCIPDLPPTPPEKDVPITALQTTPRKRGSSISSILRKKAPIVVPPPTSTDSPDRVGREKTKEKHDRHDSTFSSVSSSFENERKKRDGSRSSLFRSRSRSEPPPSPTLSLPQLVNLKSILTTVQARLKVSEQLAGSFERNLVFLLAVKELSIKSNKKLNIEWKRGLCKELNVCRDELGRVFSRKLSLSTKSADMVREMLAKLDSSVEGKADTPASNKRSSYLTFSGGRSQSRSRPPLTHQRQHSAPVVPRDEITLETVNKVITNLKKDIEVQKLLDECILDAVTRKCWKARWVRSPNMRIEMRRFVGFVLGRVGVLGDARGKVGAGVGQLVLFCEAVEEADEGSGGSPLMRMGSRQGSRERMLDRGKEGRRFSWR
jgi:hypothetical protein